MFRFRGCMCSSSLSCWFWPDRWRVMTGAASRCTDSPSQCETWRSRTCRMERSAWEGPSEELSLMERKVRSTQPVGLKHLQWLSCKHLLIKWHTSFHTLAGSRFSYLNLIVTFFPLTDGRMWIKMIYLLQPCLYCISAFSQLGLWVGVKMKDFKSKLCSTCILSKPPAVDFLFLWLPA